MKKILLAASLLATITASAQRVNNKLAFEKGRKLEMTFQVSQQSTDAGNASMDATIVRVYDIEDVEKGNAVIEHKIKRIKFDAQSMMGSQSFDSENSDDMKNGIGKALDKILKNKYTITVDQTGKVVDVKEEIDDTDKQPTPEERMILSMVEQIAGKLKAPEVGELTEFAILPPRELAKGDSWTDSTQARQTSYKVTDISDDEIVIDYTEKARIEEKHEENGITVNMSSTENTTGTIRLDRASGLLKTKTVATRSEGSMNVMGQEVPLNSTITKTWTVK